MYAGMFQPHLSEGNRYLVSLKSMKDKYIFSAMILRINGRVIKNAACNIQF